MSIERRKSYWPRGPLEFETRVLPGVFLVHGRSATETLLASGRVSNVRKHRSLVGHILISPAVSMGRCNACPKSFCRSLLGETEQAFAWLERAYEDRSPWLDYLK